MVNPALPETWEVTPLNTSEKVVARRLIPQLSGGGYLLADGNYDANPLYDLAGAEGYQLVTPLPQPNPAADTITKVRTGCGASP